MNVARLFKSSVTDSLRLLFPTGIFPLKQNFRFITQEKANSILNGTSANYLEEIYETWRNEPKAVDASWDALFRSDIFQKLSSPAEAGVSIASKQSSERFSQPSIKVEADKETIMKYLAVQLFIRSFQMRGHRWANLDPLGISEAALDADKVSDLTLKFYGLDESDLDTVFYLPSMTYIGGNKNALPLKEIIRRLEHVYCGKIGLEFMYMNNYEQCVWLRNHFEPPGIERMSDANRWLTLKRLIRATLFERFLEKKYPSEKRFGIEGCEAFIPAMKTIIDMATRLGVDTIVIGMSHRGRLNVLANITRKSLEEIFCQFHPDLEPYEEGSGDVKYHLGTSVERLNRATDVMTKLCVVANASHLEAVDPVVQGKTRAEQFYRNDTKGDKVMSILVHGDAAFCGQGIVYETLHLSNLPAYTTHGTIHIVVNNQIGFTTDPRVARSSSYCTDVARVVNAPIFHVNADDVESVVYVSEVAAKFRQTFKKDVVIDIVGYRRFGHNEVDDPSFTHPFMYSAIKKKTPVLELYAKELIESGTITKETFDNYVAKYQNILDSGYANSKSKEYAKDRLWLDSLWTGFFDETKVVNLDTGVSEEILSCVGQKFGEIPEDFTIHKGLERVLRNRQEMVRNRKADWAIGEALAIGSILLDGKHVRLSGQDVERGTFSHRHHVLHDQEIPLKVVVPLNELSKTQGHYTVCNSSLSEFGVLGFELGYSVSSPHALVIWEAQFGDFANNAQCIIDQFITSGQAKWIRQSGLVLLLPHGYEGMGPEHSSARVERFLQLCDDDLSEISLESLSNSDFVLTQLSKANISIANCTTPANFFHVLRRQLVLPFRKPLIIFSPKSLLRSPYAVSSFDEITPGTSFQRLYKESGSASRNPASVNRLIFCSGKVYYDLILERKKRDLDETVAISRLEQISPVPFDKIKEELETYSAADVYWVQEEPQNMGAYSYIAPRLTTLLNLMKDPRAQQPLKYVGRNASASVATGNKKTHYAELTQLLNDAFM